MGIKRGPSKWLKAEDKRTVSTVVYLSPKEREIVERAAVATGISLGELLRSAALANAREYLNEPERVLI